MTDRPPFQCAFCAHLAVDPERTCGAFPAGIPGEIWSNEVDHRKPYPGDNGIRWAPLGEDTEYPR